MLTVWSVILGFGLTAFAQTTTTGVFLPIIGSQALVASLSSQNGETKTLVIRCPDGTDSTKCGFPTPVTVTAGPSMVSLTTTIGNSMTVDLKCGIEGSTKASCTQTYTGPASLAPSSTGEQKDGSQMATWSASQTINSESVTYFPVTITAGFTSGMTSSTAKKNAGAVPTGALVPAMAAGLVANVFGYF